MDEKKTIKISLSTVICLFIIFALTVALFWMYTYYNSGNNDLNSIDSNTTNNKAYVDSDNNDSDTTNSNITNKKVNKVYDDKELVFSSYNNFSSEYSYSIPYINIKSSEVEEINKKIEKNYKELVNEQLDCIKENGYANDVGGLKYNSYVNDNILSLVIKQEFVYEYESYETYNIDIYTGKAVTNSEIIAQKNITEIDLLNKLEELYRKKFIEKYGTRDTARNTVGLKSYDASLSETVSRDNYSIDTPMFLDEEGKLNVVAYIYSLAGAKAYYHIININI